MMNNMGKICTVLVFFLLALPAGVMAAPPISTIAQGNTVFLGEEGLDITDAMNGAYYGVSCGYSMNASEENAAPPLTRIGWWASAANIYNSAPSRTIDIGSRYNSMMIAPSEFAGYTGNWYLLGSDGRAHSADVAGCGCTEAGCIASMVFTVQDPNLDIRVMDATLGVDATSNGWITTGSEVAFKITTNLYQIGQRPGVSGVPITIRVQSPDGASYSSLINKNGASTSIDGITVPTSPYSTGAVWDTGRSDLYPYGTYRIWAECNVNSMKDNYDVVGKTYTDASSLLDQERNPLIGLSTTTTTRTIVTTSAPTTVKTTGATTVPTTIATLTTEPTPFPTAPPASPTALPTAAQTQSPGFGSLLAGAALLLALAWSVRKE
ncbi:MAG: DUF3821 domain-containing protein [Methanoregulaceae archaeon]|nr:MAG: DUF3821 domain-containing protein [Methanoregulaceae archaeon]